VSLKTAALSHTKPVSAGMSDDSAVIRDTTKDTSCVSVRNCTAYGLQVVTKANQSVWLTQHHDMKTPRIEIGLWLHEFLTLALDGVKLSATSSGSFTSRRIPSDILGSALWNPRTWSRSLCQTCCSVDTTLTELSRLGRLVI